MPRWTPSKLQDIEVLTGLRLDGFVGGDDQQHQIDAADSGEHVAHETLVTGDIDEPDLQSSAIRRWQGHVGEAEIDGDAAAFFFGEAVGVDAGEGLDQRGFAVVDVAGGADDDGFHLL